MYCQKCGSKITQGDQFCRNCGVKLNNQQPISNPSIESLNFN